MKTVPLIPFFLSSTSLVMREPVAVVSFHIGSEGSGYQLGLNLESQTGQNPSHTPPPETGFLDSGRA